MRSAWASAHRGGARVGFAVLCTVLAGLLTAGPASAAALGSTPVTGTIVNANSPTAAGDGYIVVLKQDQELSKRRATRLASRYGGRVTVVYSHAVNGFAARLSRTQAARLATDPAVDYVERNQVIRAVGTVTPPSWGLDRIDQRTLPLDRSFTYGPSAGVTVYVIDTGISLGHTQFSGPAGTRVSSGYDAIDGGLADDGNGHGTFVSAIIAGATHGVAAEARLVAVRVLDSTGSGTTAQVVAGMDWVARTVTEAAKTGAAPLAVANLSLGGGPSSALDAALRRMIAAGVTCTVAAGNAGADVRTASPARVAEGLTVAATDQTDQRPSWSNYGSLVDLFAPGAGIISAWNGSATELRIGSGTSFAAPHVAGAVAMYLARNGSTSPSAVSAAVVDAATTNVVRNAGKRTANRLLSTVPLTG